jgi:3-hydroxy acid dehydrogenase/malonic semialdehyde reductase
MKTIVITGASVGIGAAVARRFASDNLHLVLIARRKEKLEELQLQLGKNRATIVELDVTSREATLKCFAKIEADLGSIDILVNNAGGAFGLDKAHEANLDDWEKCIAVNINGLVYCTHAVLPGMVKRNRGHIINLSSIAANYAYPGGNVYCGAKAFVKHFSLNLRADLLGTNVRVTSIEPGLVGDTEFSLVRYHGDEKRAQSVYEQTQPLKPEDIAEVIHFCAHLPPHVNINSLEMMPVCQATAPLALHRS